MSDDVEFEVTDVSENYTKLELEVILPGPADEVFSYFVEPRKLEKWWPDEALTDPKPGGRIELSWPMMGWTLSGKFIEVSPVPGGTEAKGPAPGSEGKVSFTWSWRHAPELPERTVTVRIVAAEAGDYGPMTHMLIVQGAYNDSDQDQDDRENHYDGWEHFLGKLARVLIDPDGEDTPEDDWNL